MDYSDPLVTSLSQINSINQVLANELGHLAHSPMVFTFLEGQPKESDEPGGPDPKGGREAEPSTCKRLGFWVREERKPIISGLCYQLRGKIMLN